MNIRRVNIAFRYMWTAWLNIIRWLSLGTTLVFLAFAMVTRDLSWFLPAGIAGGVFFFSLLIFLLESPGVRCLGCGGTFLRPMRCSKHKTAKRILGSYTLHSTLMLATYRKSVHCPYCGMRYRISRTTRSQRRKEEEEEAAQAAAEAAAAEEKARAKAKAKNAPYY